LTETSLASSGSWVRLVLTSNLTDAGVRNGWV